MFYLIQKQLASSSDLICVLGIVENLIDGLQQVFRRHRLKGNVNTVTLMSGFFTVSWLIPEHGDNDLFRANVDCSDNRLSCMVLVISAVPFRSLQLG
jgi:hypothetical protein